MSYLCYAAYNDEFVSLAGKIFKKLGKDVLTQVWNPDEEDFFDEKKIKVIMARGGTAITIRKMVSIPVVEIPIPFDELIKALLKASAMSKSICMVGYNNLLYGLELLDSLLNVNLKQVLVHDEEEMLCQMLRLKAEGVEVIIGGMAQTKMAIKLGMKAVMIELSERALEHAYNEAISILEKIIFNVRKNEELNNIIDHTSEGCIALDRQGKITITNHTASSLIGQSPIEIVNKRLTELFPEFEKVTDVLESGAEVSREIISYNNRDLICDMKPLKLDDNSVIGALITFSDIKTITKTEHHIRVALLNKGLFATYTFDHIIGKSREIRELIKIAKSYAETNSTVFISGETGVGKELLSQSIHNASDRKNEAFVAINCASIPESILESELFGYVEGAFTGARKNGKIGLFELAHKGTIFLDEISEMPISLQGRLLRVLQERQIVRLGSDHVIPIDIRVIAATNREMSELADSNQFRKDLFYRLNVLTLLVPSLRERKEDIGKLALIFWEKYTKDSKRVLNIDALNNLSNYYWPGNIRQLKSFMEKVSVISKAEVITGEIIENMLNKYEYVLNAQKVIKTPNEISEHDLLSALEESNGNKARASELLCIHRSTFWRLMKKYEVN